ncbi:hypothetical protein GCM10009836_46390 [Pseudonocardia ailaonensis]|uniref:Glycosyl transferase family 1 domain-containing protein n=1 Tax=Pseudonocardia ailaonensis TaxID=367279 RepID=A0ABN2NAY9_9PSEU
MLEVEFLGHHLHYVRHLVQVAGADVVVLTTRRVVESDEFRVLLGDLGVEVEVLDEAQVDRRGAVPVAVEVAARRSADLLVLPDGDFHLVPLLRLLPALVRRGPRVRVLVMRTTTVDGPERLRPATLAKPVLVAALSLVRRVEMLFLTDAFGVVRHRRGYRARPVRDPVRTERPDPGTPDWLPARGTDGVTIGVLGVISARKNVPLLVAAAARVPAAVVVVAGRLEPDVRRHLAHDPLARDLAAAGRLVVRDGMLDDAEFEACLRGVDVLAVLYDNDAPSGIVAEACLVGTPCLVPHGGWLARVVGDTGTGLAVHMTEEGVAAGVRELVRDRERFVRACGAAAPRIGTADFTRALLG